jgi:Protein of unknown function (DUF3017)
MAGKPSRGPAGPGRARAGSRGRAPRGAAVPYLLVLLGCAGGFWWASRGGVHAVRGGTVAVAGAVFLAALARLVLPESRVGMLASRRRTTDVVTLAALGAGLLAAGLML